MQKPTAEWLVDRRADEVIAVDEGDKDTLMLFRQYVDARSARCPVLRRGHAWSQMD